MRNSKKKKFKKLCCQEQLILQVTGLIAEKMHKKGMSIKTLAREINISQKSLKEFMRGDTDANIRMVSDIMLAMDSYFEIKVKKRTKDMDDIFTIFDGR